MVSERSDEVGVREGKIGDEAIPMCGEATPWIPFSPPPTQVNRLRRTVGRRRRRHKTTGRGLRKIDGHWRLRGCSCRTLNKGHGWQINSVISILVFTAVLLLMLLVVVLWWFVNVVVKLVIFKLLVVLSFPGSMWLRCVLFDRPSSVVITLIEGIASCKDIEMEFTNFFASGWRCTARPIGPDKYVMRFPSAREVEKACYQDRFRMHGCAATLRLSPWTASVGAEAELNVGWVRVANIPLDKRSEKNASFAASLVGVPLEIDLSTLHKPEYVRVLLGCRDISKLPAVAEGCLGRHFYDFFYEVDSGKAVVVDETDTSALPSPSKRPCTTEYPKTTDKNPT